MMMFSSFIKEVLNPCSFSRHKPARFSGSSWCLVARLFRSVLLGAVSFWIELSYFFSVSFLGFWVLKILRPRVDSYGNLDLFFTSVSATTVSSMSTVEMEAFSNPQLIVLTILMFIGGEVFVSMVGIHLRNKTQLKRLRKLEGTRSDIASNKSYQLEMVAVTKPPDSAILESNLELQLQNELSTKCNSTKFLGFVVLGYLLVVNILGVVSVSSYLALVSSAKDVLKNKGLNMFTFSVFTVVSSFGNCGFVPTNENMVVFAKNSGLLLILIPQILLGNTLFPSALRLSVWLLGRYFKKAVYSNYLLKNTCEVGNMYLLPALHSTLLAVTVFGFILVQFIVFCSMEWHGEALSGLSTYQKIVGALFQTVNARHAGESIVDLSIIAPAILVLFVVMMYLPPYTSFLPVNDDPEQNPQRCDTRRKTRGGSILENLIFSQLSYLAIFVILICITERQKMKLDPLNFNVLNIVVEVVSAYGNVGFSMGYSCKRQLNPDVNCTDKWYGFSGRWSDEGKIVLMVVMFFGRLKKYNMNGGKAWILL